jgi:hypothetical protein
VGAPDGGPGLPGTGWSVEHGDLRVPHFIGLHGLQVLPICVWLLTRRRVDESRRARLAVLAGGSYAALFLILIWQALRGQPIVSPDAVTLVALLVWAVLTVGLAVWPFRTPLARRATDDSLNWINP